MSFSELDNVSFEQLKDYIENGNVKSVPPEIAERLSLMELIRTLLIDQHKEYDYIIKFLQLPPYSLQRHIADKIFSDTVNFHYTQKDITESAICNLFADKLEKLAKLCIAADKFDEAAKCFKDAAEYRLKALAKKDIPDEIYDKRITLYNINPELAGGKKADRNKLAAFIDAIPDINEADRSRLHRDAMTGNKNGFFYDVTDADIELNEDDKED